MSLVHSRLNYESVFKHGIVPAKELDEVGKSGIRDDPFTYFKFSKDIPSVDGSKDCIDCWTFNGHHFVINAYYIVDDGRFKVATDEKSEAFEDYVQRMGLWEYRGGLPIDMTVRNQVIHHGKVPLSEICAWYIPEMDDGIATLIDKHKSDMKIWLKNNRHYNRIR